MPSTAEPPEPRRLRRAWLVALMAAVLVLCLVGAFFLGVQHTPKGPSAEEQAQATVPVYAPVERRVVSDGVQVTGTVRPGATTALTGAEEGLLVRRTLQDGQTLAPGVLLGVVDGVPRFGLDGPLLHRDWVVQLNLLADADGTVAVRLDRGEEVEAPVATGLSTVYVRVEGAGTGVVLTPRAGVSDLCIGRGLVGVLVPR